MCSFVVQFLPNQLDSSERKFKSIDLSKEHIKQLIEYQDFGSSHTNTHQPVRARCGDGVVGGHA